MQNFLLSSALFAVMAVPSCNSSRQAIAEAPRTGQSWTVMFYNVENLFDTEDDPLTRDEAFTPGGSYAWTAERLAAKYGRISEIVLRVDSTLPALIGLCEVENRRVLEGLVTEPGLRRGNYQIVHRDSPDERGIDAALLYRPDQFEVVKSSWVTVKLNNPEDPDTRDILWVQGKLGGDELYVFVNHWPSRSGGQKETEPNRIKVAGALRSVVDSIMKADAGARMVLMGDFNDYPTDRSLTEVLGARTLGSGSLLVNLLADEHARGEGSHWYGGSWGVLDHLIVSSPLLQASEGLRVQPESAVIFSEPFMLYTDKQGNARPSRTYAGEKYIGGYSDHLPVYLRIVR
jgi:predicted extracellular nuclease